MITFSKFDFHYQLMLLILTLFTFQIVLKTLNKLIQNWKPDNHEFPSSRTQREFLADHRNMMTHSRLIKDAKWFRRKAGENFYDFLR